MYYHTLPRTKCQLDTEYNTEYIIPFVAYEMFVNAET